MNDMIGVAPVGEWRFGTDIMDLYRSLIVSMQLNGVSQKMIDHVYNGFGSKIDDMQKVLDLNHSCSEIHIVAIKP